MTTEATGGKLAANVMHFARALRAAGLPVGPGRVVDALQALEKFDERRSRVVEMRCFGGLTVEETAAELSVSVDTVKRDWRLAKAWLLRELGR